VYIFSFLRSGEGNVLAANHEISPDITDIQTE
jgi:hypothetical protein